jgi:hypothetical protein
LEADRAVKYKEIEADRKSTAHVDCMIAFENAQQFKLVEEIKRRTKEMEELDHQLALQIQAQAFGGREKRTVGTLFSLLNVSIDWMYYCFAF